MTKGLEVSEIHISQAHRAHYDFRLDSEFYSQANLRKEDAIKRLPHKALNQIADLIAGPFGSAITAAQYDAASRYRYIRATDVKSFFINDNSPVYVQESTFNAFPQFHLREGDILLTVVGMHFGKSAIIYEADCPSIFSCKSTLIRDAKVNPWYLLTYLSCAIGHGLIRRGQRGAAQPGINLSDIATVLVPILSNELQTQVEALIKHSRSLVIQSHSVYGAAEMLLLTTLGMAGYSPAEETINVKSLMDSFHLTGRIDAEYYQPKYEQIISRIKATTHAALSDLVSIVKSIEPGSDAYTEDENGLPFLRVADYSKYGINSPQKCLTASFVSANKAELDALMPKKNTILFSKDGSVGEAYCLREDANLVTSSAILHLTVRDPSVVLPDYLTLALNSILVKMQAERDAGGSVILHWRTNEISNVVVPLVAMATQQEIAELLKQSFELKAKSERVLDVARRVVEIAIEKDEKSALAFLKAQA